MYQFAIKGATIIDPYNGYEEKLDVFIKNNRIFFEAGDAEEVIDARGLVLAPGLIDIHVHLRDPGFPDKEDIISGTRAAARGGFTAIGLMPNTKPVCDTPEIVRYQIEKAKEAGFCQVYPYAAATIGEAGEHIAQLEEMFAAGARHVSDDGMPVRTAGILREVMERAWKYKMLVSDHCEDHSLTKGGLINEGEVSRKLGVKGLPAVAEEINVARNILLSEYLDIPTHIAHLSCEKSVTMVREAKARGVKITAEVCPHHFSLNEEAVLSRDANFRMYPPLRTERDRLACIEGVRDNTIDIIASDHAPHTAAEKANFETAPNGIVGLETMLPLAHKILVEEAGMELMHVLSKLTIEPAKFLGLELSGIKEGAIANLCLIDFNKEYRFDKDKMFTRSRNTSFDGWQFKADVKLTMLEGRITYVRL